MTQLLFIKRNILQNIYFQRFFLLSAGLFIFLFFFNPIETEDVWWHLSTGRWIIEHWQLPHVDVFPFSNEVTPWSCHNEWLGSVLLYLVVKSFGLLGLKVFRSLFFLLVIGILLRYSYKRLPSPFLIIFALLVTFGISSRSFLKPDLFNIFFIQIFLINLFNYEDRGNRKNLWVLPFVMAVWFNIHLGALIYGISLVGLFFLSACIQYFRLKLVQGDLVERVNAIGKVKDLGLTLLACLASFLLNPYGIEGFLYPFKVFLIPDYLGFYKFASTIQEMQPPWYIFKTFDYFYYFLLFALGLSVFFFNRKKNLTLIILFVFSSIAFLYVGRNSAFFTMVCAYVFVIGIKQIDLNDFWQRFRFSKIVEYIVYSGIAISLMVQITTIWSQKNYMEGQLINNRFLEDDPYSGEIIKLLIENKIKGPILNSDSLGGKMIWFGYPDLRPFRDGRNNSYERSNNFLLTMAYPQENWPKIERYYNFKIILLRPNIALERGFLQYLSKEPTWQMIAIKGPLVLYVKRGEFNLPKELEGFEASLKAHQYCTVDDLRKLKEINERKNLSLMQRLSLSSVINVDLYNDFISEFMLGYQGAAIEDLTESLKVADRPQMQSAAEFVLKQYPNLN